MIDLPTELTAADRARNAWWFARNQLGWHWLTPAENAAVESFIVQAIENHATDLRQQIELFEAMKEGAAQRIADLERRAGQ